MKIFRNKILPMKNWCASQPDYPDKLISYMRRYLASKLQNPKHHTGQTVLHTQECNMNC